MIKVCPVRPIARRRGRHAGRPGSWLVMTALCLAAVWLSAGCERRTRSSPVPADTTAGPVPRQVSFDAAFRLTRSGRPRSILRAQRMEQYETEDSTYTVLRGPSDTSRVRVYVFDPAAGDSSATITADRVVLHSAENRFEAYGDVVVTTRDGRRLQSEHLTWNEADRKIRTRRFVRIQTPTERVQGTGLVADEDLDTYSIGRFTAQVEVDEDPEADPAPDPATDPATDPPPAAAPGAVPDTTAEGTPPGDGR